MAVASAGPYASLHLTPDRYPRHHPTAQFFTGRMPVAYLGGHWAMPPPWPEHKIFLNTLNQKFFLISGEGAPDPFFSGEGTPPPHTPPHWRLRRLEPRVFGSAPLHKILNTPLPDALPAAQPTASKH